MDLLVTVFFAAIVAALSVLPARFPTVPPMP